MDRCRVDWTAASHLDALLTSTDHKINMQYGKDGAQRRGWQKSGFLSQTRPFMKHLKCDPRKSLVSCPKPDFLHVWSRFDPRLTGRCDRRHVEPGTQRLSLEQSHRARVPCHEGEGAGWEQLDV